MAAHFLGLTEGSKHMLPSIFPAVSHVGRFNLTPDAARDVLLNAETHLGMMAVPYAMSLHEDLMRSCIKLADGAPPRSASELHQELTDLCGTRAAFHPDSLAQFHVLRELRNAVIHEGGNLTGSGSGRLVGDRVLARAAELSASADRNWKQFAGRSPKHLKLGDKVNFGTGEMFLALAVTKSLAAQANAILADALPPEKWAKVLVTDFLTNEPKARVGNADQVRRKLFGWRRFHYKTAEVPDDVLLAEARTRGLRATGQVGRVP